MCLFCGESQCFVSSKSQLDTIESLRTARQSDTVQRQERIQKRGRPKQNTLSDPMNNEDTFFDFYFERGTFSIRSISSNHLFFFGGFVTMSSLLDLLSRRDKQLQPLAELCKECKEKGFFFSFPFLLLFGRFLNVFGFQTRRV